jgi:flavin-dependent dehydrogenase
MPEYDAAVIGAGPAGSTVARLLASWGYSVVIISHQRRAPERAETLPPSSRRLFRLLDVHDDIDRAGFYSTAGNTAWWGSDEARVETYAKADGPGYQVQRGDFDHLLLELAKRAGAVILRDAVRAVDLRGQPAMRLRSGSELRARFAIDASGRAGILARSGLRIHEAAYRTVAICGTRHSVAHDSHTLIESYRDGWAWSVPVSSTQAFVTVMIDTRATRTVRGNGLLATYEAELDKTHHIRRGSLASPVWACDASLYHASIYAGPNYLLVGDAGSFVDPLSSYGVKKAMSSAWLAATVVNTCLRRSDLTSMAIDYFNTQERQVYADQMRQTAGHYRRVAAVEPHPFWTQRSQAPTEAAFFTEPELCDALDQLKRAKAIRLRRASCVHMQPTPRISGREIVIGEGLSAPGIPTGVEYLQGVHLWKLAEMAEAYSQVPDLFAAYNTACPPVALPNFLSALSVLVARNVLTNEGHA